MKMTKEEIYNLTLSQKEVDGLIIDIDNALVEAMPQSVKNTLRLLLKELVSIRKN